MVEHSRDLDVDNTPEGTWKHRMAAPQRERRDVEAAIQFGFNEAKIYWMYDGRVFALRMSKEMFDQLEHRPAAVVPKIDGVLY